MVDALNLFFRVRHTVPRQCDLLEKLGMSLHMMFAAANKVVKRSNVDHVIFALEGRNNWRKTFYSEYKKQRADQRQKQTEEEQEEEAMYFGIFNEFIEYLEEKTNCSVIGVNKSEADDVIARWIALHPDDEHVILSSDTDFYQLLSDKVTQYNGITKETITLEGKFDDNGNPVIDKKTFLPKVVEDPKWLLFEKCIRGDKSDNVFSAYPGVRKKGTKTKIGMLEAFADRNKKGYAWNNFMLQRWADHHGTEHRVLDDYERNKTLIDLSKQPQNIIDDVDRTIINTIIVDSVKTMPAKNISFSFMKFCGKHELLKLAQYPGDIVVWLNKPYKGHILNLSNQKDEKNGQN